MSTKRVCLSMFAVVPFHSKKNDTQAMLRVFYVPANLLPQIAFRVHGTVQGKDTTIHSQIQLRSQFYAASYELSVIANK